MSTSPNSISSLEEKPRVAHHDDDKVATPLTEATAPALLEKKNSASLSFADSEKHAPDLAPDNVLAEYSEEQVMQMGRAFARKYELPNDDDVFARAAALARLPSRYDHMSFLTEEERLACYDEEHKPFRNMPRKLIAIVCASAMGAAVQGMDETVINGALLFYPTPLALGAKTDRNDWLQGLVNGAPYLCCAGVSCWMTDWLNNLMGRKRVIFVTCLISAIACLLQAFAPTGERGWHYLFAMRFLLGFGIGPKSATVSVYLAECSTKKLRGIICMNWQTFTAFGIMWGYIFSLIFYKVGSGAVSGGLNWRLMLASAMIPAILVLVQIPWCPESPRWLMGKGRYKEAYESTVQIRPHRILACRDLFYQHVLLLEEESLEKPYFQRLREVFSVRRNRNAFIVAFVCAFMQQFCAINVIAYYSSAIFLSSGFTEVSALCASLGFGLVNFFFAIPAFFMIDRFGRRFLLLNTFPLMAVFLFVTGFAFWIPGDQARIGVVSMGIYIFSAIYSFGCGVVPFVIAGEVFPLYVRAIGASLFTIILWGFNFILSLTWPRMLNALHPQGAFGFYAGWNVIGWFLVYFLMPETKQLTLEELDEVFDVPLRKRVAFQFTQLWPDFQEYILRRKNVPRQPPLDRHHRLAVKAAEWDEKANVEQVEHA
ncbi:LANO_0F12200g1_1 [Lachancea nothofagi CBS 11611]|uniref:LANO_0F12200g1_1 n=1 Tax=Lachancea nothofagi CBS 11611 TaxID=1266666 RepID=A0A1G4KB68_9SACH|nr:LANO_0F12200g1_1 [Lachancea nothofagi CBS 11611]